LTDREAKIGIGLEGQQETVKGLKELEAAEGGVAEGATRQTKAAQKHTENQKALNASTSTYAELLSRVHPALGAVAAASVNAVRIAGDLATRQFSLTAAWKEGTAAVRKYSKSLLLIGAGGAVVAAISLIAATVHAMTEAFTRSTEAVRADSDARDENIRTIKEQEAAIRSLANARTEMERMDVAGSRDVRTAAQRDVDRFHGAVGYDAARDSRAMFYGTDLSPEEQEQLVLARAGGVAIDVDARASGVSRSRQARAALSRSASERAIEAKRKEAEDLSRELAKQAFRELSSAGGSTENLAEFVKQFLRPGQDASAFARQLQAIGVDVQGATRSGPDKAVNPLTAIYDIFPLARGAAAGKFPVETLEPQGYFDTGPLAKNAIMVPRDEIVQMTQAVRELTRMLEVNTLVPPARPTIAHQTNVYTNARAARRVVTNGETVGRARE